MRRDAHARGLKIRDNDLTIRVLRLIFFILLDKLEEWSVCGACVQFFKELLVPSVMLHFV